MVVGWDIAPNNPLVFAGRKLITGFGIRRENRLPSVISIIFLFFWVNVPEIENYLVLPIHSIGHFSENVSNGEK